MYRGACQGKNIRAERDIFLPDTPRYLLEVYNSAFIYRECNYKITFIRNRQKCMSQ